MNEITASIPYTFSPQLIVRTPVWPFDTDGKAMDILELLQREEFLESIYLASPVLYHACIKLKSGAITDQKEIQKIHASLVKYYQRMVSRCTPFGLFSGCSMVDWIDGQTIIQIDAEKKERHTRLDMHYLCALSQHIAGLPPVKNRLLYFPNNSIYTTADEIRYVEYKYINGRRIHQISAVTASDYLEHLLKKASGGIRIPEMQDQLMQDDITTEEAMDFIEELLEGQVLTNELEPAITGAEFIYQLLETLQKINVPEEESITKIIATLQQIDQSIIKMDAQGKNPVSAYKEIIVLIESLGVAFEENKLFQTDLVQYSNPSQLQKSHQETILECLHLYNGLFTRNNNDNLDTFSRRFYERFEDKEMPLLQVLDAETGIGYLESGGKNVSPLLDEIAVPVPNQNQQSIAWGKTEQWLFNLLKKATTDHAFEIEIKEVDIKENKTNWDDLPPSISVMFRLVNEDKLLMESFGGSSAANLLGRFAHGDEKIKTLVREIAKEEQKMNPEIVFAEIVHLPESRVGNILLHPVFRDAEIPYLAKSSLTFADQVSLEDLTISVVNKYILLRSKKLNKEIIPRLSSAHNFSNNALPVYQFLCDVQTQNLRSGFSFYWGNLSSEFSFLPRVVYKNIILSEATWVLDKKDIAALVNSLKEKQGEFQPAHPLPRYFVLADGDNELLVDQESPHSIQAFCDAIKNRQQIVLKEFLQSKNDTVKNAKGDAYINQFVASLLKTKKTYTENPGNTITTATIPRSFVPGTEWFYVKLYCGAKSADKILEEFILPLKNHLSEKGMIDQWFFIRYADPQFHIRVRFHLKEIKFIGDLMAWSGTVFQQLQEKGLVWKVQLDTYNRELERYAGVLCEIAEKLFSIDSDLVLQFLAQTEGDEREEIRWLWGLKNIDHLLDCFDYTLQQKEQLMEIAKNAFAKEFNFGKISLQTINKKFAGNRKRIEAVLEPNDNNQDHPLVPEYMFSTYKEILKSIATEIIAHCNENGILPDSLMTSFMHMSLNRLFLSESRMQEALIYEFLYKWYVSLKHRTLSKNNDNLQ